MELRQIRSFLSIAETLHFGRTAEMIHLSQPALSLQIRALEDEIGVRLFERNRRKTVLTAAGIAFREDATGALLRLDQAVHKAKLAANGKLGILRIGFISTAGNEIVPGIIRQFRELNAEVEFSLRNVLTTDQIQMLEAGSLDIGFLRLPIGGHSEIEVITVHRETLRAGRALVSIGPDSRCGCPSAARRENPLGDTEAELGKKPRTF
jgi:DNA-binding transcriptional LysR family regulator